VILILDVISRITVANRWIYSWQIVYDGNFSAELFKPKTPENDIHLVDVLASWLDKTDTMHILK